MRKIFAVLVAVVTLALCLVAPADAGTRTKVIVLPGATSVEGITAGTGSMFYASDLFGGDIYRGDVRRGTAELFIDVPTGVRTVGMDFDAGHDLLFAAGWLGKAYVYSTRTRALVASYTFGDPQNTFINDVTLTPYGAWFTDSLQPRLFFVPVVHGIPGPARTLWLSGPAAEAMPGVFNLNGITSTPSGRTLLVAPDALGMLCTIDPITGVSTVVDGVTLAHTDGLVLEGRTLWAVQSEGKVTRWHLSGDLSSGDLVKETKDPLFRTPLVAAKFGNRLAVTNAHLDTGFPPTNPTYEVLIIDA